MRGDASLGGPLWAVPMTGVGRAAPAWFLAGSSGRQQRWPGGSGRFPPAGGHLSAPGPAGLRAPGFPEPGQPRGGGRGIRLQRRGSRARFAACREGRVRRAPRRAAPSPALPSPPLPSPLPPGGSGRGRRRPHVSPPGLRQPRWARRAAGTGSEEGAMNPAAPSRRRASPASPLAGSRGLAAPQPWYVPGGWGRVGGGSASSRF